MAFHFDATAKTQIYLTGKVLEALVRPLAKDDVLMVSRMLSLIYPYFPPEVRKVVQQGHLAKPGDRLLKPEGIADRQKVWDKVGAHILAKCSGNVQSLKMKALEVSDISNVKMIMTCEYTRLAGPGLLRQTVIWEMPKSCRLGFAAIIHALDLKMTAEDVIKYVMGDPSPSNQELVHTTLVYGTLFDTEGELMEMEEITGSDEEDLIEEPDLPENPEYSLGYNYMIRLHNAITNPDLARLKTAICEWATAPRQGREEDDSVIEDLLVIENRAPKTPEVNALSEYAYRHNR